MSDDNNSKLGEEASFSSEEQSKDALGGNSAEAKGEDGAATENNDNSTSKSSPMQQQKSKIDVLLKPAGDAPIMKKKKWAVDRSKPLCSVNEFIKKYLKFTSADSLFLYVNQSFSPSPDTELGVLFDCFGSDGKLVLHYCKTQAWG